MAKRKNSEIIRELSEQLGDKIDGMLDTLGLNDMSEEDLMNILSTAFSNPRGIIKSNADRYYSYDIPDYACLLAETAQHHKYLSGLERCDAPCAKRHARSVYEIRKLEGA